jgi:hypothetical protein
LLRRKPRRRIGNGLITELVQQRAFSRLSLTFTGGGALRVSTEVIAATALAQYLSKQDDGMEKIRDMIVDDIRQARQRQDKAHVVALLHVLHHFLKSHPEVCPPQHPWSKLY